MRTLRSFVAAGVAGVSLLHCQPHLGRLEANSVAQAGQPFTITVHANDPGGFHGGIVGCVVQLPNGVAILDVAATAWGPNSPVQVNRDTPALLALYTAEPGHWLASFDANVIATNGALTLVLQAPAAATAPLVVKVALAGDWTGWATPGGWWALDPMGVTDFAQISGAFAASIGLVATPLPFVRTVSGLPSGFAAQGLATGDVDGDGADDLVGLNVTNGSGTLRACMLRAGTWQVVTSPVTAAYDLAVADFDRDGALDIATPLEVLWGNGLGGFTPGPAFPAAGFLVAVGDIDADGLADVAIVHTQSTPKVYRNNGNRTFSDSSTGLPAPIGTGVNVGRITLRDVTGDGFADLVLPHTTATPRIDVHVGNGLGQWAPAVSLTPAAPVIQALVGDITGDGTNDIVAVPATGTSLGQLFLHQGGGVWGPGPLSIVGDTPRGLELIDDDRDGRVDIVAVDSPSNGTNAMWTRMRLMRDTGGGIFVAVVDPGLTAFGVTSMQLATGDFDGDTFPDLATSSHAPLVFRNTRLGLSPFGEGCSAAGHAPRLDANGAPTLGNGAFALQLHDGVANGGGLVWVGFSKRYAFGVPQMPFELSAFGAPGCSVLAEQVAVRFVLHDPLGTATMPMPLPADPSLHTLLLFAQGAALVPGANPLGALLSGGLALRLD